MKNFPLIFFFDGIHKDYHKPTDTVDKNNFDIMEKRGRFIFLNAWNMVNRNEMPKTVSHCQPGKNKFLLRVK